jgi:small subunit ribosomal protein S7
MSRRKKTTKREVISDPVYNDMVVAKFVTAVMWSGKKGLAQKLVYEAIDELKKKVPGEDGLVSFKKALENCKPQLEVRSRRVGGATYQVPVDVRPSRRQALAMRWILTYARARGEKTMAQRMAAELFDAYNNRGNTIKKREDVHKMAEANKAFSHYNW